MIVEVIPEAKFYKNSSFSYLVPDTLQSSIQVGSIVTIPFGKRKIRGMVIQIRNQELENESSGQYTLKEIILVNPLFTIPKPYFKVIEWIAKYYLCTSGEALALFLPPDMKRPPKNQAEIAAKEVSPKLKRLSQSQNDIYQKIIEANHGKPHLLYGVTGSGKTEIYIALCFEMLKKGKSCLVLVPEIILTPQTIERFRHAFGDNVSIIHSNLSSGEKYRAYNDFYHGQKQILIGPRSALLVPCADLGLIIVDEEHEDSYKQDQSPRYHAVDLAEKIAHEMEAMLILGSATPRIESYHKTQSNQYILHALKVRYNKLLLPPAEIVDLKDEIKLNNYSSVSLKLQQAIFEVLKRKKQAILFLNRRGSSTFVSCRECGEVLNCPNCGIPLVHHIQNTSYLFCHHCGYRCTVPTLCPSCQSLKIKFFGAGVEKVEQEVRHLFPTARIFRIDAETIKNKDDYQNFYNNFKNHKFDIVIGTQMISKGFDIPHVDLVGIISADTGLHLPYFRASEKIFRLITQVSGRSGRAENTGRTIIQTYWPGSKAIQAAARHDYSEFYQNEISNRQKHCYPPFCNLIRIISEHEKPDKALAALDKILPELDKMGLNYIGPGPCFFQRLRGRWRYHILIKLPGNLINGRDTINKIQTNSKSLNPNDKTENTNHLRELWKDNLNLVWDVDPIDLL